MTPDSTASPQHELKNTNVLGSGITGGLGVATPGMETLCRLVGVPPEGPGVSSEGAVAPRDSEGQAAQVIKFNKNSETTSG